MTDFIDKLSQFVAIRTVKDKKTDDAPFGLGIKRGLNYILDLAKSFGFEIKNYDNYIGEVIFGEGEPFGVLCHLDVVPEGSIADWSTPPFELTKKDDNYFGRGVVDDKGPLLACLYALKKLKDEGAKPNRQIKLIIGCDEESGWGCIEHYKSVANLPTDGFSPDADFPVIYAEKGILQVEYKFKKDKSIVNILGGTRANVVCDFVKVEFDDIAPTISGLVNNACCLLSYGVSAHASTPQLGINAMKPLIEYLDNNNLIENGVYQKLFLDSLNLTKLCDESGFLTMSPNLIRCDDNYIYITVDYRYPATLKKDFVLNKVGKIGEFSIINYQAPLYVDKDDDLVKTLLSIYNEYMGLSVEPIAIGGGTYARAIKHGVAFGPTFLSDGNSIHQPNEFINEKTIKTMLDIYYLGIKKLCC